MQLVVLRLATQPLTATFLSQMEATSSLLTTVSSVAAAPAHGSECHSTETRTSWINLCNQIPKFTMPHGLSGWIASQRRD